MTYPVRSLWWLAVAASGVLAVSACVVVLIRLFMDPPLLMTWLVCVLAVLVYSYAESRAQQSDEDIYWRKFNRARSKHSGVPSSHD